MESEAKQKMIKVCQSLIEMLEMAFQGFRMLTEKSVDEAEEVQNEIRQYSSELTHFLISKSPPDKKGGEWTKPLLSVSSSFDRMSYSIEGIVHRLKDIVREHILFSDRGIKEINDVFQEAMDLLESLPDLILTQDKLLAQRIGKKARLTLEMAREYSEDHEERLFQGICTLDASPIYAGILESLKAIIVHTVEVSGKIVSLSLKS